MPAQAWTYNQERGQGAIREDLWDKIKDLDAIETYVSSNSGTVPVRAKLHEWAVDPIVATTSQIGTIEGVDTTYDVTDPTRLSNYTQIIERGFKVTMTTENSEQAGFASRFAREQLKKMKEWKNQLEYSVVAGVLATGDGTANARRMKGLVRFASTLATQQSAVSLSSAMLNAYLGNAWAAADNHNTILVGRVLKERISGFTVSNTRNVPAREAEVVGRIDVYDSDHGRVKIVKHRYVNDAGVANHQTLVSYIDDYILVGFLDRPHFEDRARTGYAKAGAIVGEATVQVSNEKAVQFVHGLL